MTADSLEAMLRAAASTPTPTTFDAAVLGEAAEKVAQLRHALRIAVGKVCACRRVIVEGEGGPGWADQRRAVEVVTRYPIVPEGL